MAIKKNKSSVAIFYDGNYLGRIAKYYGSNNIVKYKFNIEALHQYIIDEAKAIGNDSLSDIYISSAHYFRSRHNALESLHRKNQLYRERMSDDVLHSINVESHYTPYSTNSNSGDDAFVCNWLSIEILDECTDGRFDLVVLVGGASSYLPLIHKLNSKGIDTMIVGWDIVTCDGGIDIRTCEQLFTSAAYSIIINEALDLNAEGLDGMLTPIISSTRAVAPPMETQETDDGEREISEVITLKQNFGFIRFPNNNLFFRATDYLGDYSELKVGDTVEFIVATSEDGQGAAKKVTKIESNLHLFDDENFNIDDDFIDWEK